MLSSRRLSAHAFLAAAALLAVVTAAADAQGGRGGRGGAVANCSPGPAPAGSNELTSAEREAGWKLLFDGKTTAGWREYRADSLPSGWQAVDGAFTRVGTAADIVSTEQFGDFELTLDWKLCPEGRAGNSGLFFRVTEAVDEALYWGAPEIQILDDARHGDGRQELTSAGSNYALHPAPRGVVRAVGEWNTLRLLVRGNHVEQWLNGQKVVEYELHSDDWKARVAASKFRDHPNYGMAPRGHIALQEHGSFVAFRNIKIREIR